MPEARGGGRVYRPGDRVLQLKNDYTLEVFNGDLGTVRAVEPIEQELLVALDDGREIRYPFASLHQLTHAYAISVHKAQGAEFPAVVIPLLTSHAAMLGRTLLYTAVTRAQRLVVIVGQQRALAMAVKDWRRAPRHTALAGLLGGTLSYTWPRITSPMPEEDSPLAMPESLGGTARGSNGVIPRVPSPVTLVGDARARYAVAPRPSARARAPHTAMSWPGFHGQVRCARMPSWCPS